jgi:hypothetical protein
MVPVIIRHEHRHNTSLLHILHGLGTTITFDKDFLNALWHPNIKNTGETGDKFTKEFRISFDVFNSDRALNDFAMGQEHWRLASLKASGNGFNATAKAHVQTLSHKLSRALVEAAANPQETSLFKLAGISAEPAGAG